jgi:hypothetical protein
MAMIGHIVIFSFNVWLKISGVRRTSQEEKLRRWQISMNELSFFFKALS